MTSTLSRFLHPETQPKSARTARVARTDRLHSFTLADLEREAYPDEWVQVRDNPAALEAFALMLRESQQIRAGELPRRWTGQATCSRCGPVPVAPFLDGETLQGCRWCAGRGNGAIGSVPDAAVKLHVE